MKDIKKSLIVISALIVVAAITFTYVGALWSQNATAESNVFKSANIGFDINLDGITPSFTNVDLGAGLVTGDSGEIILTVTNTGTISENVAITSSPIPSFLEFTIDNGCSTDIQVNDSCKVKINWLILNIDTVGGLPFDISLAADVNHGGWQVQRIVEILGVIAFPTPTPTSTETPTETPTPTATVTEVPDTETATEEVEALVVVDTETPTLQLLIRLRRQKHLHQLKQRRRLLRQHRLKRQLRHRFRPIQKLFCLKRCLE